MNVLLQRHLVGMWCPERQTSPIIVHPSGERWAKGDLKIQFFSESGGLRSGLFQWVKVFSLIILAHEHSLLYLWGEYNNVLCQRWGSLCGCLVNCHIQEQVEASAEYFGSYPTFHNQAMSHSTTTDRFVWTRLHCIFNRCRIYSQAIKKRFKRLLPRVLLLWSSSIEYARTDFSG